jgi:hypothetical protein
VTLTRTESDGAGSSSSGGPLQLVGAIAKLLNTGLAAEETLATVAEKLRIGLGAQSVLLWLREPNATTLRAITAPLLSGTPRTSRSFAVLPDGSGTLRLPILHEGERLGMLDFTGSWLDGVRTVAAGRGRYPGAVPGVDRALGRPGLRSRPALKRNRGATLSSLWSSTACQSASTWWIGSTGFRSGTGSGRPDQGLRKDEVVGRPVFEVLTRQPMRQLKEEFDQVLRRERFARSRSRSPSPASRNTTASARSRCGRMGRHHPRITIGEDVTDTHRAAAHPPE